MHANGNRISLSGNENGLELTVVPVAHFCEYKKAIHLYILNRCTSWHVSLTSIKLLRFLHKKNRRNCPESI